MHPARHPRRASCILFIPCALYGMIKLTCRVLLTKHENAHKLFPELGQLHVKCRLRSSKHARKLVEGQIQLRVEKLVQQN